MMVLKSVSFALEHPVQVFLQIEKPSLRVTFNMNCQSVLIEIYETVNLSYFILVCEFLEVINVIYHFFCFFWIY